jgi:hypothetical protein
LPRSEVENRSDARERNKGRGYFLRGRGRLQCQVQVQIVWGGMERRLGWE